MRYIIYNTVTGFITGYGYTEECLDSILVFDNNKLLESNTAFTETHFVDDNNQIQELSEELKLAYRNIPGPTYLWNPRQGGWIDTRTQEEIVQQQWDLIKRQQKQILNNTDWLVIRAIDTNTTIPADWQQYRQQIRDITNQQDPFNIQWPVPPQ